MTPIRSNWLMAGAVMVAAFPALAQTPAAPPGPPAAPSPMPAADVLAGPCYLCHGTQGRSPGAHQSIAGTPATTLAKALRDFRSGDKAGTIMQRIAKGYSDAEIDVLAAYFAAQKP
ncbi:MAG: cytochrome c class I [Alphaproteobacteria bacterium]|nr:cytochrome c class I [Alphaproteobacteria bacterium]